MSRFKVVLTDEQIKNIFALLDRVDLKGHTERRAMNDIEQAFYIAEPIEDTPKAPKNVEPADSMSNIHQKE